MSLISSRMNAKQAIIGVKVDSRKRKLGVDIIRLLRLMTVSMILLI